MEDNSKLFVFEKKEVALIFIFVLVIGVTSFTLGVRVGKGLSLKNDGYGSQDTKSIDLKSIDLKSVDEEATEQIMQASSQDGFEGSLTATEQDQVDIALTQKVKDLGSDSLDRLGNEFKDVSERVEAPEPASDMQKLEDEVRKLKPDLTSRAQKIQVAPASNSLIGKYTVQLTSEKSKDSAEEFSDAFIAAGYDVIINEAVIPGKGKWYRVSIGAFNTVHQAKAYLEKEKGFFQGKDYIIRQFKQ